MNRDCRVVISGIGVVAPNGVGLKAFWRSLLAGESGIDHISGFDASQHPIRIAGEISEFSLSDYLPEVIRPKRLARQTQLALAATKLALDDSGLNADTLAGSAPIPIIMGVGSAAIDLIERCKSQFDKKGPMRAIP